MKIVFCHGMDGSPTGTKPTVLRAAGHDVTAPALPRDDFARSLELVRAAVEGAAPDVLIGSSRGGALAMCVSARMTAAPPLVLLAPAWRRFGAAADLRRDTRVIHGVRDDVVPLADSVELADRSGLPAANLIAVNDGHRLSSTLALAALLRAVGELEGAIRLR